MYLLGISLLVLFMRYFEVGPLADMNWWYVLIPFGVTAAWWTWADLTGYTKRKAMDKMDLRKRERHEKQRAALGLAPKRKR